MTDSESVETAADERFLDDALDQMTEMLAAGESVCLDGWAAERPHLAARLEELLRLAADVSIIAPTGLPDVAGYELVRELGRGGMGAVWLAKQQALGGRLVALKVLPHGASLSQRALARFRVEALALARLRHPNIVAVFDVPEQDELTAFAMEFVDGPSLLEVSQGLEQRGSHGRSALPRAADLDSWLDPDFERRRFVDVVAEWGAQIARALEAVHAAKLLHRDVKPSNVLIRRDGVALLTDFGVAQDGESSLRTHTGAFLGTPAYASPEQVRGVAVDARTDVYGLGATLYHVLAGQAPFGDDLSATAIEAGRWRPLRSLRSGIPPALATIVEASMDVDPDRRYPSAGVLADDLERFLAGESLWVRPAGAWLRLTRSLRRHRSGVFGAVLGGAIMLALAIAGAAWWFHQQSIPARVEAEIRAALLEMVDPSFDERVVFAGQLRLRPERNSLMPRSELRFDAMLAHLDAALQLRRSPSIQAMRDTVELAARVFDPQTRLLEVARLPATTRAARLLREKRPIDFRRLVPDDPVDRRCLGLLALLTGAVDLCVTAWEGLDLDERSDPLVDASLGLLYWQRDQPALAWPRLQRAVAALPEVGFLRTNLADAALRCGDPRFALRMVERADGMERPARWGFNAVVRAQAWSKLGMNDRARTFFESMSNGFYSPMARLALARWRAEQGEYEKAAAVLQGTILRWPMETASSEYCREVLASWWASLAAEGRIALLRSSLTEPGSFLDLTVRVAHLLGIHCRDVVADLDLDSSQLHGLRAAPRWLREVWLAIQRGGVTGELSAETVGRAHVGLRQVVGLLRAGQTAWDSLWAPPTRAPRGSALVSRFEHVDRSTEGQPANGPAWAPSVSADGRFVLFASAADNLVANDRNAATDLFLRDRELGVTQRIEPIVDGRAVEPNGATRPGVISADGRHVAFLSTASQWSPNDVDDGSVDCFVLDRETGTVTCVSRDASGTTARIGDAWTRHAPRISADGSYVAFYTRTHDALPETDVPYADHWVVVDRRRGTRMSVPGLGGPVVHREGAARFSEDGQFWWATLAGLETEDRNVLSDVYSRHLDGDLECFVETWAFDRRSANGNTDLQDVGGGAIVVTTQASNIVTVPSWSRRSLLLREPGRIGFRWIAELGASVLDDGRRFPVATSRDWTAFSTRVAIDGRRLDWPQVFVYRHDTGDRIHVSQGADGLPANGPCESVALSESGLLVFSAKASNLGSASGSLIALPLR